MHREEVKGPPFGSVHRPEQRALTLNGSLVLGFESLRAE
jgi:hypothetical protein